MRPIFEAVLANDPAEMAAIAARTPASAAQRMEEDLFVAELSHTLYRDDAPGRGDGTRRIVTDDSGRTDACTHCDSGSS